MASKLKLKNNIETEFSITHKDDTPAKSIDTNDLTYTRATVADMEAISNPQDGDVCFVKDLDRGGSFIYDSSEVGNDNQGTNFNGWIRQYSGSVNVKWFGAHRIDEVGYENFDNSNILNYLVDNDYAITFDDGVFLCNSTIGNRSSIKLSGDKNTVIRTNSDIDLFSIGGQCVIENIKIEQTNVGLGTAFTTSLNGTQLAYSKFNNIRVINFKFGLYVRYSLWNSFENMQFLSCKAGIVFSGNDLKSEFYDVQGGWNSWSNGFFHNANSFNNILCSEGELGIFICGSNNDYGNITCQNQNTDGTGNSVLPDGVEGTGIWITGNGTYYSGNHVFNSMYFEGTKVPIYLIRAIVSIEGLFVQGGSSSSKFPYVARVDSSVLNVDSSWGQDWFEDKILFESTYNNSTVNGYIPATVSGDTISGSGFYRPEKYKDKRKYYISHTANGQGTAYTLDNEVLGYSDIVLVTITALSDGYIFNQGAYLMFTGSNNSFKSITEIDAIGYMTLDFNGFKPRLTIDNTLRHNITIYVQRLSPEYAEPSSTITVSQGI